MVPLLEAFAAESNFEVRQFWDRIPGFGEKNTNLLNLNQVMKVFSFNVLIKLKGILI